MPAADSASPRFRHWMDRFDRLQKHLDRSEPEQARALLLELDRDQPALVAEGIDYCELARIFLHCARSEMARQERRLDDAVGEIQRGAPRFPLGTLAALAEGNLALQMGNIALIQGNMELASSEYDKAVQRGQGSNNFALAANALFNRSICLMLNDQDSEAVKELTKAAECYTRAGRQDKLPDVYHQIGNAKRVMGDLDQSGGALMTALKLYVEENNCVGQWRSADDLARTLLAKSSEHEEAGRQQEADDWAKQALDYSMMALAVGHEVWSRYEAEGRLADLSEEFFHPLATLAEAALRVGEVKTLMAGLAVAKGRSRLRSGAGSEPPDELEFEIRDSYERQRPFQLLATSHIALHGVREATGSRAVALIDQIALPNGYMLSPYAISARDNSELGFVDARLDDDRQGDPPSRQLRAARNRRGQFYANRLLSTIAKHSQRCCFALGSDSAPPDDGTRNQLREWANELRPDLKRLGDWIFPSELLNHLREAGVEHVVLVPDPSLATVPFLALETAQGSVLDQPWSLSVAYAVTEIPRLLLRYRRPRLDAAPIVWLGPDEGVNVELGGNEERRAIEELVEVEPKIGNDANSEAFIGALAAGRWVHFRGHGVWTGSVASSGPRVADRIVTRSLLDRVSAHSGYVVTAACRTGFSETVGTEVFGSLVDYERANVLGAVLSLWPIHGPFTAVFMKGFYSALHASENVARSIRDAARSARELAPHPFFWASFAAVGGWDVRGRLIRLPGSPSTTNTPSLPGNASGGTDLKGPS